MNPALSLPIPRRSILHALRPGESTVFHHPAGRQKCQSTLTTIQSRLETGRFSQRSAQLIDAGRLIDVTIITCLESIKGR